MISISECTETAFLFHCDRLKGEAIRRWKEFVQIRRFQREQLDHASYQYQKLLLVRSIRCWRSRLEEILRMQQIDERAHQFFIFTLKRRSMESFKIVVVQKRKHEWNREMADAFYNKLVCKLELLMHDYVTDFTVPYSQQLIIRSMRQWRHRFDKQMETKFEKSCAIADNFFFHLKGREVLRYLWKYTMMRREKQKLQVLADDLNRKNMTKRFLERWKDAHEDMLVDKELKVCRLT